MISLGKWRWPAVLALPLLVLAGLYYFQKLQPRFETRLTLTYSGQADAMDKEMAVFNQLRLPDVTLSRLAGEGLRAEMVARASSAKGVVTRLETAFEEFNRASVQRQKDHLGRSIQAYDVRIAALETKFQDLTQQRKAKLVVPGTPKTNVQLIEKIEALKARRRELIDNYPTHGDIPVLAKQIKELLSRQTARPNHVANKIAPLDRLLTETKLRRDYFSRMKQAVVAEQKATKPSWKRAGSVEKPQYPYQVEGWPLAAGAAAGVFALGLVLFRAKPKTPKHAAEYGHAASEVKLDIISPEPTTEVAAPEAEVPSDPMTQKAAELYGKWMEVAGVLYKPAAEAPQGVLDSIEPLLQESMEFLPNGHDVLTRYLARSVEPGNLTAHVARTVLMSLLGAEEAGVSAAHRSAMALAALFHDLALVPRPAAQQDEAGSEVGRLSASVIRRIPGLTEETLPLVEDILIGMDEHKMETWQNGALGKHLEPLSKVLREIDRFEKVMQKQKARMTRQPKAANS